MEPDQQPQQPDQQPELNSEPAAPQPSEPVPNNAFFANSPAVNSPVENNTATVDVQAGNSDPKPKKSKKKLIVIIVIVLFVLLAGGGVYYFFFMKSGTPQANSNPQSTQGQSNENGQVAANNEELLPVEFLDPSYKIAFDTPDFQRVDMGSTLKWKNNGYFLMYDRYNEYEKSIDWSKIKTPQDIISVMTPKFLSRTDNIYVPHARDVVIESNTKTTMNGREVSLFEGYADCTADDGSGGHAYIYGYGFIMDGIPAYILGSANDPSKQTQEIKDEIKLYVNAMVNSLRSERRPK